MWPVLFVSFLLLGCDSVGDVVARHRGGVEKTFIALKSLAPLVDAVPAVTEAKVKAAPVVLEGSGANAMFIYEDDLPKPGHAQPVHLRTLDSAPLLQCGSLLSRQVYFADSITRPTPSAVESYLVACERLKYILVIREVDWAAPLLLLETKKFSSGRYRAEVLAVDLQAGELLGVFPVTAKNEESVMLLDGDADHSKRLQSNLESTIYSALREATRQAFPGSLPSAR